jgi:hypothetical protein
MHMLDGLGYLEQLKKYVSSGHKTVIRKNSLDLLPRGTPDRTPKLRDLFSFGETSERKARSSYKQRE